MLADLRIRNLAIVEDLELAFEPGFNVVTGETGAGKSILMRAIGLALGARGDADLVRQGAAEAEVEALYTGPAVGAALGTDAGECIVRRVIATNGRHRAWIDDRLVTAARLAELGERLVHVYGQHEHHTLVRPEVQRALLDAAGGLGARVAAVETLVRALDDAAARLDAARAGAAGLAARRELLAFQSEELRKAVPRAGEIEELEQERERLRHAERLRAAAAEAEDALRGEGAVVSVVGRQAVRLADLAALDAGLAEAGRLLGEAHVLLEEAAHAAAGRARAITADPDRLEQVEERVALLQRLARKYGCAPGELADRRAAVERELGALDGDGADPAALARAVDAAAAEAWEAADALAAARRETAAALGKRLASGLRELALEKARLTIAVEPLAAGSSTPPARVRDGRALTATGADEVTLLFAPNPGEPPRPLARIASGGELSRVMLALKAATATAADVPTLLFDEVDAGIGGAVAEAVGRKLAALARTHQVLCITHLPQIAACADHHFVVRKRPERGRTRSSAERLSDEARVEEIARMLAGVTITAESRRHAAELRRLGRRSAAR